MDTKNETKYERIRKIGVGSYGVVFKCMNRQTGQVVAIKRYSENDSDPNIRKIAMREVRMLRQLRHPNIIYLHEVFRRKRILHLVFDYCELTVLDVIDKYGAACPLNLIKKIIWQLVNATGHCHAHNCVHRDIKPENILINASGIVKLCDFGFARHLGPGAGSLGSGDSGGGGGGGGGGPSSRSTLASAKQAQWERDAKLLGIVLGPSHATSTGPAEPQDRDRGQEKENTEQLSTNEQQQQQQQLALLQYRASERQALTEYVATRWYRAPELLVGDIYYDKKIDIWAIGCVTAELMRGAPLWPGKTDSDQLFMIVDSLDRLTPIQEQTLLVLGAHDRASVERITSVACVTDPVERKLPERVGPAGADFVLLCLRMEPARRPTCELLLQHPYIKSAQMSQFVASASAHASAHQAAAATAAAAKQQTSTEQRFVATNIASTTTAAAAGPAPYSGVPGVQVTPGRSNSQAILRAANNQQPASKRLVLAPDSPPSIGSSSSKGGGGGLGGASAREPPLTPQAAAGRSLVPLPVRGSSRRAGQHAAAKPPHRRKEITVSKSTVNLLAGQPHGDQTPGHESAAAMPPSPSRARHRDSKRRGSEAARLASDDRARNEQRDATKTLATGNKSHAGAAVTAATVAARRRPDVEQSLVPIASTPSTPGRSGRQAAGAPPGPAQVAEGQARALASRSQMASLQAGERGQRQQQSRVATREQPAQADAGELATPQRRSERQRVNLNGQRARTRSRAQQQDQQQQQQQSRDVGRSEQPGGELLV